ncbi:hypothetical protein TRIATDRAFT_88906 [Trichoderma atroviride IMI 206040]|uniref:Uncharacterized protein n=1 Tax=Hypocrea atroviridis (strain ATCC 20476 / IMI 206040) TaxID=452589 RepID=G9NUG2_HYPAI|nr:uncharacterized protein TRIATDRAFT_88906 [Trichoderma atroviride IMI 206040]EHK45693.1 hypothetical protein TRIATDRAFT_88906 [Trichoderma atroviride IMI 206040]
MPPYTSYRRRGGEFEIPGRKFNPAYESLHRHIPNDKLLVYNASKGVLKIQEQDTQSNSLVLSIGGTCRNPGTPGARAAWGVYFGPESPYNASALLDPALPQTKARAEMEALRQALSIIKAKIISGDYQPRRCVIKTHSSYIRRVFPRLVHRRAAEKVVFSELLMEIEEQLEDMGYVDGVDRSTNAMFWCVEQEENREADGLAVDALAQSRDEHGKRRRWKLFELGAANYGS